MSNIATLNPTRTALPAAFQNRQVAEAFKGQTFEKGSEGVSGSYGLIKYGGKTWSLQYRGVKYDFLRPDDKTARGAIDVVIVRAATNLAKTYYKGGFKPGSKDPPLCFSNDGVRPDTASAEKQAPSCALCEHNKFGSRTTEDGKAAKSCGDHKRTAVLLDPPLAKEVLGMELAEPLLLRIPAASLNDFAVFGDTMDRQGFALPTFVTRLSFDHTKNFPKFKFEAIRPLDGPEGEVAMILRDEPITNRIISDMGAEIKEDTPPAGLVPTQAPVAPPVVLNPGQTVDVSHGDTIIIPPRAPQPDVVVPLNVAARLTPQQQAAIMGQQAEDDGGGDDALSAELLAKINGMLGGK